MSKLIYLTIGNTRNLQFERCVEKAGGYARPYYVEDHVTQDAERVRVYIEPALQTYLNDDGNGWWVSSCHRLHVAKKNKDR